MYHGVRGVASRPGRFYITGTSWKRATLTILSSPALVKRGAAALVLGGMLGASAVILNGIALYRAFAEYPPTALMVYGEDPLAIVAAFLQGAPVWMLLCIGLFGMSGILSDSRGWPLGVALAGAGVIAAVTVLPLAWVLIQDVTSRLADRTFLLEDLTYMPWSPVAPWLLILGFTLLGVAGFWMREAGRWRFLVPAACFLSSPLSGFLAVLIYRFGLPRAEWPVDLNLEIMFWVPAAIASVLWIVIGCVMFGAREREAGRLAKERRATEKENLIKARRLYEKAWGGGDLSVVTDLAADNFFDHRRQRPGPDGFKQAIMDLHRAFPDLRLSIEEQKAEGDTVTTRCVFHGTDLGGVLWYPPTNRRVAFTGEYTDRFTNGKLVEHRGDTDMASLLEQLDLPAGG